MSVESAGNPFATLALLLAFVAFIALLVEVLWVRRPADLERDIHLPLDEAPIATGRAPGGASDVAR